MVVISTKYGRSVAPRSAEPRGVDPQFRLLAESIPQLVWAAGSDGSCDYVNGRFRAYTGLTEEQVSRLGLAAVLHPEDAGRCAAAWRLAIERGAALEIEVRVRRHDGAYRWFLVRAEPLEDVGGRGARWLGTATDIDERARGEGAPRRSMQGEVHLRGEARGEERLRESEERLRLALTGGQLGVWEWDLPSGRVFWSEEALACAGVDAADFGGTFDDFARRLHPDDRDAVLSHLESALRGETDYSVEFRILHPDGQVRWVHCRALVQRDRDGRPLRMAGAVGDITGRKLSELTLRESEARFRNMADQAPVMIWVTGSDGRATYGNRWWSEFSGQTAAASLGFGWLDAIHPDDRPATIEIFRRAEARREPFRLDYRLRRYDGAYRWCIASGTPRFGPDDEFLGYVGSVIDITERKEAELLLQESEERFRRAVMAVPFPIMIHADDGQVVCVNRAWTDIAGYASQEIPTVEEWLARAHPAQKEAILARVKALYALEGAASGELEAAVTTANGEQRTWLFRGAPLGKDPAGRRLVISIAHDITARKQVDDTLRESEAKFRSLADAMPQIAWTARPDGSIDYYNRRWYEICGVKEGEATGDSWVSFIHPDDRQLSVDSWYRSVLSGEPLQIEYRFWVLAAREHRWFLGRAVPVRGPSGEIEKWYGTCTDIHDQKCAEATLKEADQRKDEFLAMLAHELRNPLGPLRNAVELLRRSGPQQPSTAWACGVLERQVSHMARLVDDLLDVSRVARGRIELRKQRCDLAQLLRQTAEDYRSTLEASGLGLSLEIPAGPLWVHGDPTRLSQVIGNVLHNANKFTDAGGRVTVSLSAASESSAAIRIRDTGIGMDAAMLARAFEPFSQADRSLDRSRGGLGLGLSLVKGLVQLHGGAVSAESAGIGHGTEVILRLPLEREIAPSAGSAAPGSDSAARSLRILIIEDNVDAAETLQALLAMEGHRVEVALSGPAGVAAARSFLPEVILCDIGLPGGMDGYGVARALKGGPGVSPSLMIALTGYGREEDRRRAQEAGFAMHLIKPIEPTSLQTLLASIAARP
ncbi:hybrid sensor histidine kinase/response regulator [Sorangium sp. So ce1078]|uniref:PAS domain-containing hybrid sensor histidine kinase/response regulator n=1 Tax=Sorangium sp. So ce1078 TaxID=3133329 RepID=UPI003F6476A2